jgi:methyl-accepting chemotaxis protein
MRLKIGGRLYGLAALFALGCGALAAGLIWVQNTRAIEARYRELANLIDVAVGVFEVNNKLAEAGIISPAEAKQRALATVAGMRYDGSSGYFYVTDRDVVTLMHPTQPKLIGEARIDIKDVNGFAYHREMVRQIEHAGQARMSYVFEKPGSSTLLQKNSVAKLYKPWGYIIVTGVYNDDLSAELRSTVISTGALTTVLVVVLGGLAIWIGRGIIRPIKSLVADTGRLAEGDTSVEFKAAQRHDEVGMVGRAIAKFRNTVAEMERMRGEQAERDRNAAANRKAEMHKLALDFQNAVGEIIESVASAANQLEGAATTLTQTAESTQQLSTVVAGASEEASSNVQSVAAATEELSSSVNEISRQVHESNRIANEAVEQAQQTDVRIGELSQAAGRIGEVVRLITAIAEQTNLLALNATIEAARAGEAGRGFAVVAAEVKNLANQTAKATDQISAQIAGMQSATQISVTAIKEVGSTISRISQIATATSSAVEEQGAATQEISRNVQLAAAGTTQVASNIVEVSRGASETGSASGQVLASARALASDSNHLKQRVENFVASIEAEGEAADNVVEQAAGFMKTLGKELQERRKVRRHAHSSAVRVIVDGKVVPTETIDISTSGARLKMAPGIRVGGTIRIAMPDARVVEATVVWAKGDAFGVKFKGEQPLLA